MKKIYVSDEQFSILYRQLRNDVLFYRSRLVEYRKRYNHACKDLDHTARKVYSSYVIEYEFRLSYAQGLLSRLSKVL